MKAPDKIYIQQDMINNLILEEREYDDDVEYIRKDIVDDMLKTAEDHAYLAGAVNEREKMVKEAVKWLVDDDYHEATEKGRFILGSVGLGYNGYYIPYSDLLKLPKEDEQ